MKEYKLEEIAKLINCQYCDGKGYVMRYPCYKIKMPEIEKERCSSCYGRGIKLIVAKNIDIKKDDSVKIDYRYEI